MSIWCNIMRVCSSTRLKQIFKQLRPRFSEDFHTAKNDKHEKRTSS